MSRCVSLNPYILNNENNITNEEIHSTNTLKNKDIVSILASNFVNSDINTTTTNNNNTIRRTMSFDMSSEKWLENKELTLKRVNSSDKLRTLEGKDDQSNVNDNKGGAFEDIWNSILSQKKLIEAGSNDPALTPYVHPLMKRASSLSEKSLEICTESLGSETGSDGFSISPLLGEEQEEKEEQKQKPKPEEKIEEIKNDGVGRMGIKCNYYSHGFSNMCHSKKVPDVGAQRSFPPPLTSLVERDGGSDFHMRTRREDGRLVVEAVSVLSTNRFCASRQDGRLLLTLDSVDDVQEMVENGEDEEKIGAEDVGGKVKVNKTLSLSETALTNINVARRSPSTLTISKLVELGSVRHYAVPHTINRATIRTLGEENEERKEQAEVESARQKIIAQSLPPLPRLSTITTAAAVLNAYEYYWQQNNNMPSAVVDVLSLHARKPSNNFNDFVSPQVVKVRDKRVNKFVLEHKRKVGAQKHEDGGEYLVPILRDCRDTNKSLFFLKPCCIATS